MNILKRILLQQITLKGEVAKSINRLQCLQIHHQQHHGNRLFHLTKTLNLPSIAPNQHRCTETVTNRQYSSQTAQSKSDPWWKNLFGSIRSSKSVLDGKSMLLYAQGVDQLNHSDFVKKFQMPNTFNSWFLVTEIHVWMLMVRAMAEREHGQIIRNGIVAALWTDALERSKSLAPGSMRLIKKQIEELSEQFQYAIVSYDEGLTKDDKQLASALWKRFFESNCDNYEHIELLIKYIRYNIAQLDKMSTEEFLDKRNINWPSLNDVETEKI